MKCIERKCKVVGLISKKAENIYVLRDKKAEQSEKYNFTMKAKSDKTKIQARPN